MSIGKWVLIANGESPRAVVLDFGYQIGHNIHDLMCSCECNWNLCKTEGVQDAIKRVFNNAEWAKDDQGLPFSISVAEYETGRITIYNATEGRQ